MGINIQPTAPVQSLEDALIELGQNSENAHIRNIAQYHITPKQPNLAKKIKTFFAEKWTATKAYPQAGANKVKNIFNSAYHHPTVPYIGAGLLGTATGLLMGLSVPTGFMLGVAVKLGSIGLDKGLDAINSASNQIFNWVNGSKPESENISQSSFKQTVRIVPIAVLSFSLGLNSYNLALASKIAATAVVIGAGAFAIGTTVHAQ
ncbi:hypothetical protein [Candidatus Rhabdochlamydia oedothoracis]|nr:hypothetical protein [Candidatus Rhabdochlamydia oedothoracis]